MGTGPEREPGWGALRRRGGFRARPHRTHFRFFPKRRGRPLKRFKQGGDIDFGFDKIVLFALRDKSGR